MDLKTELRKIREGDGKFEEQVPKLRKALIMAGGFGSRMKELTKDTSKPMLPINGRPLLDYSIELCQLFGIKDIAISIFYFGDQIKKHYGDGSHLGLRIIYIEEPEPLGTAGALRLAKDWLDETFLMCNADDLKDIDLDAMMKQHHKTKALATIALTRVEDPSKYGVVKMDGKKILEFVEKPPKESAPSNLINAGIYIMDPQVVELVPEGYCMVEKYVFPKLAEMGMLCGYEFKGMWLDTGTPETYSKAQQLWKGYSK